MYLCINGVVLMYGFYLAVYSNATDKEPKSSVHSSKAIQSINNSNIDFERLREDVESHLSRISLYVKEGSNSQPAINPLDAANQQRVQSHTAVDVIMTIYNACILVV